MSMDMPGGYLGQGGQKVSMRPEWANDKYHMEKRASYPSRYAEAAASGEYRFVPTGEGFETHFGTRTQKWWPDTVVNEEDGVSYTEIPHFSNDEFRSQLESAMAMGVPRSQNRAHEIAANHVRIQMEKQGATDSQAYDAYNAMRKAHYDNSRARQYERAAKRAKETGERVLGQPPVRLDVPGDRRGYQPVTKFNDDGVSFSHIPTPEADAWRKARPLVQGTLATDMVDRAIFDQADASGMPFQEAYKAVKSVREARDKKKTGNGSAPGSASGAAMSMDRKGGYLGQNAPLPRDWKPSKPTAKAAPLPRDWKPGDALPAGTVGMAPMTAAQEQAIRMAEERPTAGQIVGPVANRLRDAQVQSDANWQASNAILDTGARLAAENPDIADQMRNKAAGAAMDYGLEAARQGRQWDQDYNRLIAVQTDPNGAMMFEQYQLGQIPGYQITSNPNVSPYWKKLVAEEPIGRDPARYGNIVREGSASRAGRPVGQLQSEAMSQMTRYANRLAEGRGGQAYRDAVTAYQAALMTGDEGTIASAESTLGTLLDPMFQKFQGRFDKEAGRGLGDMKKQFMDSLKARLQVGAAGSDPQIQMLGQMPGGRIRGPQPPSASRPTAGGTRGTQPAAPTPPRRTPDGLAIHEYDSVESVIDSVKKGTANIRSGEMVVIGGRPMTAIPSTNRFGEPEMAFVEASVFGGVAVPDPTEFGSQEEWGANLTDRQRQAILDQVATDPAMRGSLGRDTLEQLDRVRRSRQGVLSQRMRPQDREAALAKLKAEEDAALFAAVVGGVGGQARNKAFTSISAANAADEARRIEALDRTSSQVRESKALDKAAEQAPLHREAIDAAYGEEGPMPDGIVSKAWSRLGDGERAMLDDMLGVFATMQVEGEDMSPEELEAMQYLPRNTLRKVIRAASQGASPVDLAAMIEAERPGFIQEYFRGNVQMTNEVSKGYDKWSKERAKEIAAAGEGGLTDDQVLRFAREQHSWMIVRASTGQLTGDDLVFWQRLTPEQQMDPDLYAQAVLMDVRGGSGSQGEAASTASPNETGTVASGLAPDGRPFRSGERPRTLEQQRRFLESVGLYREANQIADAWENMTEAEKQQHRDEVRKAQREWDAAPVDKWAERRKQMEAEERRAATQPPPPQEREIIRRMEGSPTRRTPATPSGMPFGGGQSLVGNNPRM